MSADKELIDRLLAEYQSPEEIVALMKQLTRLIVERTLQAELTTHLCDEKPSLDGPYNRRRRRRTTREIEGHLEEMDQAEGTSTRISNTSDAVI